MDGSKILYFSGRVYVDDGVHKLIDKSTKYYNLCDILS